MLPVMFTHPVQYILTICLFLASILLLSFGPSIAERRARLNELLSRRRSRQGSSWSLDPDVPALDLDPLEPGDVVYCYTCKGGQRRYLGVRTLTEQEARALNAHPAVLLPRETAD